MAESSWAVQSASITFKALSISFAELTVAACIHDGPRLAVRKLRFPPGLMASRGFGSSLAL
jgi:hypothetical protein